MTVSQELAREIARQSAEQQLDRITTLPIAFHVSRTALSALRDLAASSTPAEPSRHRVGHLDAIVAASAQEASVDVLHYDRDFDRLATVLAFESVWFAPRGLI